MSTTARQRHAPSAEDIDAAARLLLPADVIADLAVLKAEESVHDAYVAELTDILDRPPAVEHDGPR